MEETKYKTDPKLFFDMLRALTPIPDVTRVKKAEEFVSLAKDFSEKYGIESERKKGKRTDIGMAVFSNAEAAFCIDNERGLCAFDGNGR